MSTPSPPEPPARLIARLRSARRIVVLTGAGMSAESGIPTFRDKLTGLWARFDPQALATSAAFSSDPETVWAWYEWRRRLVAGAAPNAGHRALVQLAALPEVQDLTIITQNVDDLHERAGSAAVIHLHGSLFAPRCFACARPFHGQGEACEPQAGEAPARLAPPRCPTCGGRVRPGVVWFGETLPEAPWLAALARIEKADLLLAIGTSGQVYPAAGLAQAARHQGCEVAVINPDPDVAGTSDIHWQVSAATGLPRLLDFLAHAP